VLEQRRDALLVAVSASLRGEAEDSLGGGPAHAQETQEGPVSVRFQGIKLFDCFTINDELDLLELRLRTGAPCVDRFVLVEATRTFSGAEKPLHYAESAARFAPWREKIRHVVVDDLPPPRPKRWAAEIHQRNCILRGLDDAAPGDVIVVSDVDEILHPEVLEELREGCDGLTGLEMPSTFRFANWMLPPGPFAQASRALPFELLHDPHHQRNHTRPDRVIRDAGRHFTTLGGIEDLVAKFESYSHAEMDTERQKAAEYLRRAQKMGVDVFSRQLVSVVPEPELCATQGALAELCPDLFDFDPLPGRLRRELFRWYANWRARQPASSELVPALDGEYEDRLPTVATRAALELARHVTWTVPRRGARSLRERFA